MELTFPVTHPQQRLLFNWYKEPNNPAYNNSFSFELIGEVNLNAIKFALEYITSKHSALRTSFTKTKEGEIKQLIFDRVEANVQYNDLSTLEEKKREKKITALLQRQYHKIFHLSRGKLFRYFLIKVNHRKYILTFTWHHIITDASSTAILFKDFSYAYNNFHRENKIHEEVANTLKFYSEQRAYHVDESMECLEYWKNKLSGTKFDFNLLIKPKADTVKSYSKSRRSHRVLEEDISSKIYQYINHYKISLFVFLVTSLKILLYKYTKLEDICINYAINLRNEHNKEVVGFFVNNLPLRTIFDKEDTVASLTEKVRTGRKADRKYQYISTQNLLKALPKDEANKAFNIIVNQLTYLTYTLELDGVKCEQRLIEERYAKNDITLFFDEPGNIRLIWEYNQSKYERDYAETLFSSLIEIISNIVSHPEYRISDIKIFPKFAIDTTFYRANNLKLDFSLHNVHASFQKIVEISPYSIAIRTKTKNITYDELNRLANQYSYLFRQRALAKNAIVAICLGRSVELVAILLSLLKLGLVFLPLDPATPSERINFILEDANASLLIMQSNGEELTTKFSLPVLDIDEVSVNRLPDTNPPVLIAETDIAYVIYTSGSTGLPKGVVIEHLSLSNYLLWTKKYYFKEKGLAIFHSSIAVDMTITSLLSPLIAGATIKIVKEDFLEAIDSITEGAKHCLIKLTPSHLRAIGTNPAASKLFQSLKILILGGEAVLLKDLETCIKHNPTLIIINEYGPTEATVACSYYKINRSYMNYCSLPIGQAIPNTEMYILDDELHPTPVGVAGEIYIGGIGLARGYLNRPELTQEKFIQHPFSPDPQARLYKSGDSGRYLPDGNIEYLGRLDEQVKIRGYRVELGEVEAVMRKLAVIENVVVITEEDTTTKRLIAYCQCKAGLQALKGEAALISELRHHLMLHLPDYMIPATFYLIQAIPLTLSGKVDKNRLKELKQEQRQVETQYKAAQSEMEQALVKLWRDLLGLEVIGVEDNLFELGADSILIIQFITRARKQGIHLDISQVFDNPTISKLLSCSNKISKSTRQPVATGGYQLRSMPLAPIQHWFFSQYFSNPNYFNQYLHLKFSTQVNGDHLIEAISHTLKTHGLTGIAFEDTENEGYQQVDISIDLASVYEYKEINPDNISTAYVQACIKYYSNELNIKRGRLIKVILFIHDYQLHRILFICHHLMIDVVSWRVLIEDIQAAYDSLKEGHSLILLTANKKYVDYIYALKRHCETIEKNELPFWLEQQPSKGNTFSLDASLTKATYAETETIVEYLDEQLTSALKKISTQTYQASLYELILSATIKNLAALENNGEIYLALENHGREPIIGIQDIFHMVGWFTSLYPVSFKYDLLENFGSLIENVKKTLSRVPHKGVGYGGLKYLTEHGHRLQEIPFPTVSFNYLGTWSETKPHDGLFQFYEDSFGLAVDDNNARPFRLNILSQIINSRLSIALSFNSRESSVSGRQLVTDIVNTLKQIATSAFFSHDKEKSILTHVTTSDRLIYELSPMQLGFLYYYIYYPNSDCYLIQRIYRLYGNLNVDCFINAWQIVSRKYEVLRTRFIWEGQEIPKQCVENSLNLNWQILDWCKLDDIGFQKELDEYLENDRTKKIDITKPSAYRLTLIKRSASEYFLLWTFHHIILDGWSSALILQDIRKYYQELRLFSANVIEQDHSYRDYINFMKGCNLEAAKQYFGKFFSNLPDNLPTSISKQDHSYCQHRYGEINTCDFELHFSPAELENIQKFCKSYHFTMSTIFQAAWALLLMKYTRSFDVIYGTTLSGRNIELEGIENGVGVFINTLPLRIKLDSKATNIDLLKSLQKQLTHLQNYSYVPLYKIKSWLKKRDVSGLFNTIMLFENYPKDKNSPKEELKLFYHSSIEKTEYPLTIAIIMREIFSIRLSFCIKCFNLSSIDKLANEYKTTLSYIVANPNTICSSTYFTHLQDTSFSNFSQQTISTVLPVTRDSRLLHEAIELQASLIPHLIAVVYKSYLWTYASLNKEVNQFSHYLNNYNFAAESCVLICMEHNPIYLISILALLKTGYVFVPTDIEYPKERLKRILEEAEIKLILSDKAANDKFDFPKNLTIIYEEIEGALKTYPQTNPQKMIEPSSLAYIIYTSGSEGRPKGIMVEHKGLFNLATIQAKAFGVMKKTRLLQFASFSFDASISEIAVALTSGATLYMLSFSDRFNTEKVADFIVSNHIEVVTLPPGFAYLLPLHALETLKVLVVAGDKCDEKLISYTNTLTLINAYGPSEATVCSSMFFCESTYPSSTIGQAIPNTEMYILDDELHPTPVGVAGEIYIGGIGLARGYLNRPELTQEKFIQHPFSPDPQARLYKSGDSGRYLPDGNIEYLGRLDEQVKIRGYRVELGEVEAVMRKLAVIENVVVITEEDTTTKRLIAYCQCKAGLQALKGEAALISELRHHLMLHLPDYMIPATFYLIQAIPLTLSGKVDKNRLKELKQEQRQVETQYKAAQSEMEQALVKLWRDLLGLEVIGVEDNLFELGADSILIIQFITRARKQGIHLDISQVFDNPTINQLFIEASGQNQKEMSRSTVLRTYYPLSYAQQRLWFLYNAIENKALYNTHICFDLVGEVQSHLLETAFNVIVNRHKIFNAKIVIIEGQPKQTCNEPFKFNLVFYDISGVAKENSARKIDDILRKEKLNVFDLENGPLIRGILLKLDECHHILLIVAHHIVMDGWSANLLLNELSNIYNLLVSGKTSDLPLLRRQYADYAQWQVDKQQEETFIKQLSYWTAKLKNIPNLIQLPVDYPRPLMPSYQGNTYEWLIEENEGIMQKLHLLHPSTLFTKIIAIFAAFLYRYSGQDTVVLGTPIANRHYPDVEDIIGFFSNTIALRFDFPSNVSYLELLEDVNASMQEAQRNQDVPFEQIVDHLKISRGLGWHPIFQVMVVYQESEYPHLTLKNVISTPHLMKGDVSKFDLTLIITKANNIIKLKFEYATELFSLETIKRLSKNFNVFILDITSKPQEAISRLEILHKKEKEKLLIKWNNTHIEYQKDQHIYELFNNQVQKNPNAIALIVEGRSISYYELNARSNQLANYILNRIKHCEDHVAIYMDRGENMIVSLLVILKLKRSYVALNTEYTKHQIQEILKTGIIRTVLTCSQYREKLQENHVIQLYIDELKNEILKCDTKNFEVPTRDSDIAYIVYTSGSTGAPKMVANTIRGFINHIVWMRNKHQIGPDDIMLFKAPLSFDASINEIFLSLLTGAKLVVAEDGSERDSNSLIRQIIRHKVTTLSVVPALLSVLIEHPEFDKCISLRQVLAGGEELPLSLAIFFKRKSFAKLFNYYGPSECSVDSTCYEYQKDPLLNFVPIGKLLPNIKGYILDKCLNPVPIGVSGELYIGGDGVASGYLNDEKLTRDKFVPNFFDGNKTRLYKTGDLALWLPDGNIRFLGRLDEQVKIRGYRIELGEIENALLQHPELIRVAVKKIISLQREYLVAFCQPRSSSVQLSKNILEAYLQALLPSYMLPQKYVFLTDPPLTTSGKINKQLLNYEEELADVSRKLKPPTNFVESALLEMWQRLLGKKEISIDDNFFDIGGHSIMAMRLINEIYNLLQVQIPVSILFLYSTIEKISKYIKNQYNCKSRSGCYLIKFFQETDISRVESAIKVSLCLIHPLTGVAACYKKLVDKISILKSNYQKSYALSVYAIEQDINMHKEHCYTDINAMAKDYVDLILEEIPSDVYILGGWSFGALVAFEVARQLKNRNCKIELLFAIDSEIKVMKENDVDKKLSRNEILLSAYAKYYNVTLPQDNVDYEEMLLHLFSFGTLNNLGKYLIDNDSLLELIKYNLGLSISYLPEATKLNLLLLNAKEKRPGTEFRGWDNFVKGKISVHEIPGNHWGILDELIAEQIAQILLNCLNGLQFKTELEENSIFV